MDLNDQKSKNHLPSPEGKKKSALKMLTSILTEDTYYMERRYYPKQSLG